MRDAGYRTQDEIDDWKARDPITTLRKGVVDRGIATETEFDEIDAVIKAVVADALDFATNSPYPDPSTATAFIYSSR